MHDELRLNAWNILILGRSPIRYGLRRIRFLAREFTLNVGYP